MMTSTKTLKLIPILLLLALVTFVVIEAQSVYAVSGTVSDETSCNAIGGTWSDGHVCSVADLNVTSGETITIASGVEMDHKSISNRGTIVNNGTIDVEGLFFNFETITNNGILVSNGGFTNIGIVDNYKELRIDDDSRFNLGHFLTNRGTINNYGNLTNRTTVDNRNVINNKIGIVFNYGTLNNFATINNTGTESGLYRLISNDGTIDNKGQINSDGVMSNDAHLINNGVITLDSSDSLLLLFLFNRGTLENNAHIINNINILNDGQIINRGPIDNNNVLENTHLIQNFDCGIINGNEVQGIAPQVFGTCDRIAPVIRLRGAPDMTLEVGVDSYVEEGATVTDDDPTYSGAVVIGGDVVNTNVAGLYKVTYDAPADPTGNIPLQLVRKVKVVRYYADEEWCRINEGTWSFDSQCSIDSLTLGRSQTVSAWYKWDGRGTSDWRRIVGKGGLLNRNNGLWIYPQANLILNQITSQDGKVWCNAIAFIPSETEWHHIAGTYDGSRIKLYYDGSLVDDRSCAILPASTADSLTVGWANADAAAYNAPFDGLVDEARIYDRSLSAQEIEALTMLPSGYWPADGDATDAIGNGDGTAANGVTYDDGVFGQAFKLDGVDDYVAVPDSADIRLGNNQTVSVRYKWAGGGTSDARRLMGKGDLSNRNYGLWIHPQAGYVLYQITSQNSAAYCNAIHFVAADTKWHDLVGTYDGARIRLFQDAILVSDQLCSIVPASTADSLTIGWANADASAYHSPFDGLIDEVQVFNQAMTYEQVRGLSEVPVGYWPGEGNAKDAVGIGDGTVENGARYGQGRIGQAFKLDGVDDYMVAREYRVIRIDGTKTLEIPLGTTLQVNGDFYNIGNIVNRGALVNVGRFLNVGSIQSSRSGAAPNLGAPGLLSNLGNFVNSSGGILSDSHVLNLGHFINRGIDGNPPRQGNILIWNEGTLFNIGTLANEAFGAIFIQPDASYVNVGTILQQGGAMIGIPEVGVVQVDPPGNYPVPADMPIGYTLFYEVPDPLTWQDLDWLELRLEDNDGVAVRIRFNQEANTFSLWDRESDDLVPGDVTAGGEVGNESDEFVLSGVAGSNGTLESELIVLDLSRSLWWEQGYGERGRGMRIVFWAKPGLEPGLYQVPIVARNNFGVEEKVELSEATLELLPAGSDTTEAAHEQVEHGLEATSRLDGRFGNSLTAKLESILDAVESGKTNAACGKLDSYFNEINAHMGNKLTTDEGVHLIADANTLPDLLGCETGNKK